MTLALFNKPVNYLLRGVKCGVDTTIFGYCSNSVCATAARIVTNVNNRPISPRHSKLQKCKLDSEIDYLTNKL